MQLIVKSTAKNISFNYITVIKLIIKIGLYDNVSIPDLPIKFPIHFKR